MRVGKRRDKHASSCSCRRQHRNACICRFLCGFCLRKEEKTRTKQRAKGRNCGGKNKNVRRRTKPHSGLPGRRTKRLAARRSLGSRLESSSSVLVQLLFAAPPRSPPFVRFVRSFVRSSASFFSVSFDFLPLESSVPSMPLDESFSFFPLCYQPLAIRFCLISHRAILFPFEMFSKESVRR